MNEGSEGGKEGRKKIMNEKNNECMSE